MKHLIAIVVLVITMALLTACHSEAEFVIGSDSEMAAATASATIASATTASETEAAAAISSAVETVETTEARIAVYICGAVNSPGVYEGTASQRLWEYVEMAGGLREDADASGLPLAQYAVDEESLYVPFAGEVVEDAAAGAGSASETSSLVNINTAAMAQLKTLPGIGDSKAAAIISYREEHGSFKTKDELMEVPGIKESVYSLLEALITI